ncbi:Armadillo-like helical [Histomonas meleagridis]|uniref:Armadillo-like helical n=1 Tax=Histomonas meleagridis TaxID=135588 RepID=UPI00355A318D|nr:Armadillo-like helical [Histomonas meleagridis]KAH0802647.1 Armadillo-like helical [Histomonas meleagridis]
MSSVFDEFVQSLLIATGQANGDQQAASTRLLQFKDAEPIQYLDFLSKILLSDGVTLQLAFTATVFIRNLLRPTKVINLIAITNIWLSIPEQQRMQIKQALVRGLMFKEEAMRNCCANLLANIEQIEIKNNLWPDFFNILQSLIVNKEQYGEFAQLGALSALNEFFRISDHPPLIRYTRKIQAYEGIKKMVFEICFQVLSVDAPIPYKSITLETLYNAIRTSYYSVLNKDEGLRNQLFTIIINNFPHPDPHIHESIYKLLAQFIKCTYTIISMEALEVVFKVVTTDFQSNDAQRIKMFLQFWKKVSKIEKAEIEKIGEKREEPKITKNAASSLLQYILVLIPQIDENVDDNLHSIGCIATETLHQFCKISSDSLIEPIVQFFTQNFQSQQWQVRYSAFTSFRCIAKIHNTNLTQLFRNIATTLANISISDPSLKVSEAAILLFGDLIYAHKLSDNREEELQFIGQYIEQLLKLDTIRSRSGCYVAYRYFYRYKKQNSVFVPLTNVFPNFFNLLFSVYDRPDIFDNKFLTYSLDSIINLFEATPQEALPFKIQFSQFILNRLYEISTKQTNIDSHNLLMYQTSLITMLKYSYSNIHLVINVSTVNDQFITTSFTILYELCNACQDTIGDKIFDPLGYLIVIMSHDEAFRSSSFMIEYTQKVISFIDASQQSQSPTLISSSSMVIGDLYRSSPNDIVIQYTPRFIELLVSNIKSDVLTIKDIIEPIYSLSEIIRALKDKSLQFRPIAMEILQYFSNISYDEESSGDILEFDNLAQALLYLSGAIIIASENDEQFFCDKGNCIVLFGLFTSWKLCVDVFKSQSLYNSIVKFLDEVVRMRDEITLKYHAYINNRNVTNYLIRISNSSNKNAEKARELLVILPKK